jgi:glycosyltransferase involved in cell wall biosynthesis
LIRGKSRNATLRIVGKIGNHFETQDGRVQIAGWVEKVQAEYEKATVVINPTLAGTGLKIKSVEALCNAKPLVATPNAVEGLCFAGDSPFVVCHDWRAFADTVVMLLTSDEKRRALQMRALEFAKKEFSSEKVYATLSKSLEKLLQ